MKLKNVEDIYPLTPMQAGMLFHTLYAPDSGSHVMNVIGTMPRRLDLAAFKQSWERLIAHHPALRTACLWEGLDEPLQVVRGQVKLPWEELDWRGLPASEHEGRMRAFLAADRRRGLDPSKAPLMRLTHVRATDEESYLVWTYHHLMLDGWSIPLIFKDVFLFYEAAREGREWKPAPGRPFRDYVAWLGRQDMTKATTFWQESLAGFTPRPTLAIRAAVEEGEREMREQRAHLTREKTAALQAFSREHRLTVNTFVQGALALVLGHHAASQDVAFGATVSGRPSEVEGIETMVGLFINMLPTRVRLSPDQKLLAWLRGIQERRFEMQEYEYFPLAQIQRLCGLSRGQSLFDCILTFENYPVEDAPREQGNSLDFGDIRNVTVNNYPLTIIASAHDELALRLIYDERRVAPATVTRMHEQLTALLEQFVARAEATLGDFEEMLKRAEQTQVSEGQKKRAESHLNRFKQVKPKAVSVPRAELVRTDRLAPGAKILPLVMRPNIADLDIADWASGNREFIETKLSEHGALLFRDCHVNSVAKFEQLALGVCRELFGEYGDLPREGAGGKVYGSTPYPQDQVILFHNESSHTHRWPMKIWFHCVRAAAEGGETPVVDCREVYRLLDPRLRQRFAEKGLMYVRNFTEGLDVSWQEFFRTEERGEVERFCREAGVEFEWHDAGGKLRTRKVCRAVAAHPKTGEMLFFNQLQLHHVSCLDPSVRRSLAALFREEDFPRHVYYGDGTPIEDEVVAEVLDTYRRAAVAFPWQEGDVMLLDNMLTAHGRNAFRGQRKIVVAMGEMVNSTELERELVGQASV